MQYIAGKRNLTSDTLSRFPIEETAEEDTNEGILGVVDQEKNVITYEEVAVDSSEDEELTEDDWKKYEHFYRSRNDLWHEGNVLFMGHRMVIPQSRKKH